jgi:hypothetical protein
VCVCSPSSVQGPFAVGAQKLENRICGYNTAPPLVHFWWVAMYTVANCSSTNCIATVVVSHRYNPAYGNRMPRINLLWTGTTVTLQGSEAVRLESWHQQLNLIWEGSNYSRKRGNNPVQVTAPTSVPSRERTTSSNSQCQRREQSEGVSA